MLLHELGHLVSLNAVGSNEHHLGEVDGPASNFLTETTACMFASWLLADLSEYGDAYGLTKETVDALEAQLNQERSDQQSGFNSYMHGFTYCDDLTHPATTYYDLSRGVGCAAGGYDNRHLMTQQAADWIYLRDLESADDYNLDKYMQVISGIKDEEELATLRFCDESNTEELAEGGQASE